MPYHIRLTNPSSKNPWEAEYFAFDLTEDSTQSCVDQLLKGSKRIVIANEVISTEGIKSIKIISTPKLSRDYAYGLSCRLLGYDVPLDEKEPEYQPEPPEEAAAGRRFVFRAARNPLYIADWNILFTEMADKTIDFIIASMERGQYMPGAIISINGGIFVGSQIGGIANSMNTYIEQLKLSEYSSNEEKYLKEALAKLRREIEETTELSPAEKTAASTDLALFTDELVKPVDKQDENAKKLFWDRLKTVLSVSAGLGNLAAVVAKLVGLA